MASVIRRMYVRGLTREEKMRMLKGTEGLLLILVSFGMFIIPLFHVFTDKLAFADYFLPSR